ncbi:putative TIR domain, P-loop containing nucleoside triphosphate hydrolase [Helianthus annuus]|nr:putative TIR domain, P-loop containing nucleoside triphosphate hydrolase [Helianthus annuus]
MASTSSASSSVQKIFKYDVFLSFRGEDTRKTFVDHLYLALVNKGIITYKDDETIKKGERINEQLIKSIEESRYYIIVFSKNYASSSWCLDELVKIMECQKMTEHTAYPIFYDVEPTEVRNQSGSVGQAFERFTRKSKRTLEDEDLEKELVVGKWRNALKEAASLAGMELKNTFNGHEARFIQQIVKDVSLKLYFFNSSIDAMLVGMETRVKDVVSSLEINSNDVRMIGIKGMGGSGKTTLARAVFDYISIWFEGKSFIENVREGSKRYGLKKLQKQVLRNVLSDKSIEVESVSDGRSLMRKMMCSRKALLVLDDVDDIGQLEALAGDRNWFMPGSRIIITTRDEQVLKAHCMNFIHDACLLSQKEAICLLSRYAFGREIPNQGYAELSRLVVHYAAGLPITIKVLGSFLYDRTESEWKDTIKRLKTIPLKETLEKLEISYNGLENDQREIFLDIACILKDETKKKAIKILESCGFRALIGLRVLEQKSLISISKEDYSYFYFNTIDDDDDVYDDELFVLHDHIEEMGMDIVRRLHPDEPKRQSRLWIKEEIEDILVNELGSEEIKCIKLEYTYLDLPIIMKGLRKMKELRLLYVGYEIDEVDEVDEVSKYLPPALQSLYWHKYPLCCLPKSFQANKLVNLEMSKSNISELWEGGERKVLNKLKFLDLSYSKLRTFDLTVSPYLEELDLRGCHHLFKLHMPVECPNLKFLNLSRSKVSNINLRMTPQLEHLNLARCGLLKFQFLVEYLNLKFLNLSHTNVSNLNLGMTPHLEHLNIRGCDDFVELQLPVECSNLKILRLGGSKLSNLNLGMTPYLEHLDLTKCSDFVELQMPVECPNLKTLNLSLSKVTNLNLGKTPHLEKLNLGGCAEFVELQMPIECPNLKFLTLHVTKVGNLNLGMTPNLKTLDLDACNEFEVHMPVECPKLTYLKIRGSKVSDLNLELAPNLERLDLSECYFILKIHAPVGCLKKLVYFSLGTHSNFESFQVDEQCNSSIIQAKCIRICPLHPDNKLPMFGFTCDTNEPGSLWMGNLEKLIYSSLCPCKYLENWSATICGLQHLSPLLLSGSIPGDLWQLESLEKLSLITVEIRHLPDSVCMLKHLKSLSIISCRVIEQLPENICRLECLEELFVSDCTSLRDIPNSICKMKCLKRLSLGSSDKVERLPEDLGCLECLKELDLSDCKSLRDIPNSICKMKRLKRLYLSYCNQLEKLPDELGCLDCLKELNIQGTQISCLPRSIYQLKGLVITGYREQLESCGFTSFREFGLLCEVKL